MTFDAFAPVNAAALPLALVPVDAAAVVAGAPSTGAHRLLTVGGAVVGVWEATTGTMTDIEADEVFVVLSGRATVALIREDGGDEAAIALEPGSICRLAKGMRTRWDVTETLRKLYVLGAPGSA